MTEHNLPDPLDGGQLTDYSGPVNPVQYLKGRGAQLNPKNRFLKNERVKEHIEAIDDWIGKKRQRGLSTRWTVPT
jgi:hypothetical protein